MIKILVVEDSNIVVKILKHVLSSCDAFQAEYAMSFAEAKKLVENTDQDYFAALIDLNLPDAPDGEVVDYTLKLGIPTIVLTGSFDETRREKLLAKGIVDYVTKEGKYSYEYCRNVVLRLIKNQDVKVLVVDDSDTARNFVVNLLKLHLYQVLEAKDGVQGIKVLLENPEIKLLITDYNMPRMDGCELVKNIRMKYEKTDLVIIGLSDQGESALSAKFIKTGANDFLKKPLNHEEFYCRVTHNMEFVDMVEAIRDASFRDDLTGAYNRKYFYSQYRSLLDSSGGTAANLSVAVLDLDNFSAINNRYGSDIGDFILKSVVVIFTRLFERFVFVRADGQQFYILMPGLPTAKAMAFVEKVRQILCARAIEFGDNSVVITFSAGVSDVTGAGIDSALNLCAVSLKGAKEAGGDLVFGDA
ncbi:MAG: diguanylate cyclase response regulator [Alteromonadaceae bacterium]|nr:MAG: diguanylate cyclase response regulator [Alteromonadaceae bacterium]